MATRLSTNSKSANQLNRHFALKGIARGLLIAPLVLGMACQSTPSVNAPAAVVVTERSATSSTAQSNRSSDMGISSSWSNALPASFDIARELVEQELDVDLSHIQLQLVDNKPINAEVALETDRLVREQFGNSPFANHFVEQVMSPLDGSYAALYSSRLDSVMISRSMLESYENSLPADTGADERQAALLTLLIHELVHAADDVRYRIHDNRELSFRASFAQSATFEGHAQWLTRRICEQAGCSSGLDSLDRFMFGATDLRNRPVDAEEAASRDVLEYSYVEGERFVTALANRTNGAALLDSLLSSPPVDPIQILAPDTYPDLAREQRNQRLIKASLNVTHPWAQQPWIGVETSPLKGINLRADPERRQAAIDGFTKLIEAMISMQFYDQQTLGAAPAEATLLQAESAATASMFANMLHTNTQISGARSNDEPFTLGLNGGEGDKAHIYRTAVDAEMNFLTVIVVAGKHVVQVSGNVEDMSILEDYAVQVLTRLSQPQKLADSGYNQ